MDNKNRISPSNRLVGQLKTKRSLILLSGFLLAGILIGIYNTQNDQSQKEPLFLSDNFEAALNLAKEEDKLCFVTFYTEFCYPCDKSEESILSQKEVYSMLKENYINFRIDGFNTKNGGKDLAAKYQVKSFPTIIITDWEGNVLQRWNKILPVQEMERNLEQSHALRTAPEPAIKINDTGPIPSIYQETIEDVEDLKLKAINRKQEYGLVIRKDKTYKESRVSALEQKGAWNRGVWIHPAGRHNFQTIIGPFRNKEEAKTTQSYLKTWEGDKVHIIRLSESPVSYPKEKLEAP